MDKSMLNKIKTHLVSAVIALAGLSLSLVTQAANLSGTIKDKAGNVIEGANALLFQVIDGDLVQTGELIQVGADGQYSWTINDGDYVLRTYFNAIDDYFTCYWFVGTK